MELRIRDAERDEIVGIVSDDGGLETDDEMTRDVVPVEDDGTVGFLVAVTEGSTSATVPMELEPGDTGYLYAVADALPSPLEPAGDLDGIVPPDVDPADYADEVDADDPDDVEAKGRFPNLPDWLQ